jgi:cytoskeleton protein RodZ
MTDETGEAVTPPLPGSATPEAAVQPPGTLLQQERIRRGLSVQQSAEGLHLDNWIIEAIESNQFLALGAPVYAKGYLRKYAALLGLAPDVIVSRYDALTDTPAVPTPVPLITTTPTPRPRWPAFLGWTLLVALVIGLGFVAFNFLMPGSTELPAPIATPSDASSGVPMSVPAVETRSASLTPPPATRDEQPSSSVPVPVQAPAPKPVAQTQTQMAPPPVDAAPAASTTTPTTNVIDAGPLVRLRLEFNESSWVEVYDAAGQRLLYDIGQPARPRVLSGAAPLNVVVGLASAVSVQVNDQMIVVPRRANRDSTRFRVDADGSVQGI